MKQRPHNTLIFTFQALLVFLSVFSAVMLNGQSQFYAPDRVQEIRIKMPHPDWRHKLDSLMKEGVRGVRLEGEVIINGELFEGCGIRFKGFSSWSYGRIKNPWNIRIDYLVRNRNYDGYTKLRLSNVTYDPSFLREILSYHVAREYMPASLAGFAMVYVNDTLIGLYHSVESVDERFLEKHYGSPDRVLIKGDPDNLVFPFGQNSNLAFISHHDSMAYAPFYKLDSDYGWEKLMRMIDVLHHHPEQLEEVLNVDRVLWMHAFNYALLNFDSYIGYAQNYYLAGDQHGRLNPVIWDLNMSFGSFRLSDGSYHFQGMTIPQILEADPLQHLEFSISPRPLMSILFSDSTWQRMYMAHLRTIISEQFESGKVMALAQHIHQEVDPYVLLDTNRLYTYAAFLNNIDTTVPGNTPGMHYVGLQEMITKRTAYLRSYPGFNAHPVIGDHNAVPRQPAQGEVLQLTLEVEDATEVWLYYRFSQHHLFSKVKMHDDGLHGDSLPGDGIWGVQLPVNGDAFHYYFYAQNDSAGIFLPARAQSHYFTLYPKIAPQTLVVNEINRASKMHHQGHPAETTHWIELFNNSNDTLRLANLWISNDSSHVQMWALPDTLLPPHRFFVVFADGAGVLPDRSNFTLGEPTGWIGLGYHPDHMLDVVNYKHLDGNRTFGRYPNGRGAFTLMPASFAARNHPPVVSRAAINLYPNPAKNRVWVEGVAEGTYICKLFSPEGRLFKEVSIDIAETREHPFSIEIDISGLPAGVYLVWLSNSEKVYTQKLIIYE